MKGMNFLKKIQNICTKDLYYINLEKWENIRKLDTKDTVFSTDFLQALRPPNTGISGVTSTLKLKMSMKP